MFNGTCQQFFGSRVTSRLARKRLKRVVACAPKPGKNAFIDFQTSS